MSDQVNTSLIERAIELADATGDPHVIERVAEYVHTGDLEGLRGYISELEVAAQI